MIDFIYTRLIKLIERFGSPRRRPRWKESEEVLKLKKYYEEQSDKQNKRNVEPD